MGGPQKINAWRSNLTGTARRGRKSANERLHLEGIIYVLRAGCPWRDLPRWFGPWQTVYGKFRRWSAAGLWAMMLGHLRESSADCEYTMVDSTIMRVHQDASGPGGGQDAQAMGRSRGGLSSKIHMACDALGYPLGFVITGGQRADCTQARGLLKRFLRPASSAIMDAGYDSDDIRRFVEESGATAVIAYRSNRKHIPTFDKHLYAERFQIENLFQRLKRYRRVATRYEKLHRTFAAMVAIACLLVWIRR